MRPRFLWHAILGLVILGFAACTPDEPAVTPREAKPVAMAPKKEFSPPASAPASNTAPSAAPGAGLLFALDYDAWSLTANPAKGSPQCSGFGSADLQLRMSPGIKGKGGGLKMGNGECCQYAMPGNLDPRQGTISLWVSPQNWKASDDRFQPFFTAQDQNWRMIVYKYYATSQALFYLEVFTPGVAEPKRYVARADITDAAWHPGVWRKLDAVWDLTRGMRIYVDGVRPASGECEIEFKTPVVLPTPSPTGKLTIGGDPQWRVNPHWSKDDETAYDNVQIYDRMLSTNEIQAEYQRYFPSGFGAVPSHNLATIPLVGAGAAIDGRIEAAEWAAATRIPVMAFATNQSGGQRTWASLQRTADALQVSFRVLARPPFRAAVARRDGNVWEDDSCEVFLVSSDKSGTKYHFIVNANGALYDERDGDRHWDSHAQAKASQDADGWSAELSIPLSDLVAGGAPFPGGAWRGNLFATYYAGSAILLSGWSLPSAGYAETDNYGTLVFAADATAVRLEEIGAPAEGRLDMRATVVPAEHAADVAVGGSYEVDGGELATYPGDLAGNAWRTALPSGHQKLTVDATRGGGKQPLYHFEYGYYVSQPLEISYACFPAKGFIEVQCDAANAGEVMAKALAAGQVAGTATLIAKADGTTIAKADFAPTRIQSQVRLALPATLTPGEYDVGVAMTPRGGAPIVRSTRLRIPDLSIYTNPPVTDHQVPPPWTPVQGRDGSYEVWGRRYTYASGPFPSRISSGGSEILRAPVELLVDLDGTPRPVRWSPTLAGESFPDMVALSGSGTVGDTLRVDWRTRLYFDGVSRTEFSLVAPTPVTVKGLSLRYALAADCGRFVLTPLLNPWQNDRLDLAFEPIPSTMKDFSLWVSGDERGLFWWPESNANWVGEKGAKQIHLARSAQGVDVDIAIIAKPVELKTAATYAMVFMGSPARPAPEHARSFRDGSWGRVKGQNAQNISWGSFDDKSFDDDCTDFVSQRPIDHDRFAKAVEGWLAKGIAPLPYSQPTYMGSQEPEYDLFRKTWEQYPARTFDGSKGGVRYSVFPCCANSQFADYIVQRAVNLMDGQPKIGGLYYDLCWTSYCENAEHGCAGVDAFGQPYMTSSAWGLRSGLMRIYKAAHVRGKIVMNHNHSLFNPIAHNFSDEWYPGEQYCSELSAAKDPAWYYGDGIAPEAYQSELSMRIKGIGICFLPQFMRAVEMSPSLAKLGDFASEEYAIRTLTPLLLHDIPVSASYIHEGPVAKIWDLGARVDLDAARFTGYWRDAAICADHPVVRVSRYAWDKPGAYRLLIVAGNLTREPAAFALALDRKALGLGTGPLAAEDALTRQPIALDADRIAGLNLAANHFLIIGIR